MLEIFEVLLSLSTTTDHEPTHRTSGMSGRSAEVGDMVEECNCCNSLPDDGRRSIDAIYVDLLESTSSRPYAFILCEHEFQSRYALRQGPSG
jgi:hypothetical protein